MTLPADQQVTAVAAAKRPIPPCSTGSHDMAGTLGATGTGWTEL
jgi:hypothetical protein